MDKNNNTIQVISDCLNNIFVSIAPVKGKAYLFGSRARGDARNDSDWDVLILLDKPSITSDDVDKVSYPVRELGWAIDSMINPVMYTMAEWEGKSFTPFYKNVMKEGVAL
ncbi:MAG: nucleotidyltransferase domain-containing protein [Bacteroidales bacterium]|nr:nucleotidyltransferase domain-containing protein [Bacteroidales bacterium]